VELLWAVIVIETLLLLVCVLELRDNRRRHGELPETRAAQATPPPEGNVASFFSQSRATFLAIYFQKTKEEATKDVLNNFDKAKPVSDFISMITSLGVIYFISSYLTGKYNSATSYLLETQYFIGAGVAWMLAVYFGILINNIIFSYLIREVSPLTNPRIRSIFLLCYALVFWSLVTAVMSVAGFLSKAGQPHP
jgi:hypothetical protein